MNQSTPPNPPNNLSESEFKYENSNGLVPGDGESLDLRKLGASLIRGRAQIAGFALIGLVVATILTLVISPFVSISTSTRLIFAFDRLQKGEYPDHSKFQPDDVRAPDLIFRALKRQGLETTETNQSLIRSSLSIEGVIPPNIAKERDRLRAAGQTPPTYIADEYTLTLTLPRKFPLTSRQRELLLNEIINVYSENFQQTYADMPLFFGNAFETLSHSDFYEYELVLNQDVQSILLFLNQQIEKSPTFRSSSTHFSYTDLLQQTKLFAQIHLNETLGLIYLNGLSNNRVTAMMKMDYYLRTLDDEENNALAEESVVKDLLSQTQSRGQNYVLGIKSQAVETRTQAPILDQGLIDSLLANDAYNFLVHRALEAGLKVKGIQAEKTKLVGRRKRMESFIKGDSADQSNLIGQVQKSLTELKLTYLELTSNVRRTNEDFAHQQFGSAIRFGDRVQTEGLIRPLAISSCVGALFGLALGVGLSLIGIYVNDKRISSVSI